MSETDLKSAEALIARGERLEARAALARVLNADPGNVHAQHLLSTIDMDEGQYDAARQKIEQLLEAHPDMAPAIYNLGVCLIQAQRYGDAATQFERTLVLDPAHSGAMYNIAWLEQRSGNLDDSAKKFSALVKHNPNWMSAREALIEAHLLRGRPEDAVDVADESIRRNAGSNRIYRLRGAALLQVGRVLDAEKSFRTALASSDTDPDTLIGLAGTFRAQDKSGDAIPLYEKALVLAATTPSFHDRFDIALSELISSCRSELRWRKLGIYEEQAIRRVEQENGAISPSVLKLFCDDLKSQQLAARRAWQYVSPTPTTSVAPRALLQPYNIGWISDDFGDHAGSHQLAAFLEQTDSSKVRHFGFNLGVPIPSDVRRSLRNAFDDFRSLRVLSDEQAAEVIQSCDLDILICSINLGANLRPGILLRKPAPVVASYLGHPGTLGNKCIDYILADSFLITDEERTFYDEAVVRLPQGSRCILQAPPPSAGKGSRSDHGLNDGAFVFCNFSKSEVIGADTFTIWMDILKATPKSQLWLGESRHSIRDRFRQAATSLGVDSERIVFAPQTTREYHLARLGHADLYLEALRSGEPSPVHNALSMGLPVLSKSGASFSSRCGAGLVKSAGLTELVVESAADYTATATRLGNNPKEALDLKLALKAEMSRNPAFKPTEFFTYLQRALEVIIERSRNGSPVSSFDITA